MSFLKQVTTLATGTAAAQLINIAIVPLLSRLFAPEAFGMQAVYLSSTTVLLVLYTGGYEHAIVADKSDLDAWKLVRVLGWLIPAVAAVMVSVLALFVNTGGSSWMSSQWKVLAAACLGAAVLAGTQICYFWINRNGGYRELAHSRLISAIGVNLACGAAWLSGFTDGWGLIAGHLTGSFLSAAYLAGVSRKIALRLPATGRPTDGRTLLSRYLVYPKFLVLSSFLDRLSSQLHIFMISSFWGGSAAGHIGMYRRVAGLPSSVVGRAVGDVFRQRAASGIQSAGQCRGLFDRTTKAMAVVALVPAAALAFAGPDLFALVLGEQWREAGFYARLLAPMFFLSLVVSPISTIIYLRQATRIDLYIQVFLLVSVSCGLVAARELGGARLAVAVFGLIYCVKYIIEYLVSRKLASGSAVDSDRDVGHREPQLAPHAEHHPPTDTAENQPQ